MFVEEILEREGGVEEGVENGVHDEEFLPVLHFLLLL